MDMERAKKMAVEMRGARSSMAWLAWEQKRGPAYMMDQLIAEVERLQRQNANLLNGEVPVCGDCDGSGWLYNRVEGRYPCTCMTEAEPYQILSNAMEEIRRVATGEDQVADDDTEGMGYIARLIAKVARP